METFHRQGQELHRKSEFQHTATSLKWNMRCKLQDTAGASIVIALVFFLLCAVVGSVVVTAASINAQAVSTHQIAQKENYAVSSAASLIAKQIPSKDDKSFAITLNYADEQKKELYPGEKGFTVSSGDGMSEFLYQFLTKNIDSIWANHLNGDLFIVGDGATHGEPLVIRVQGDGMGVDGSESVAPVYARVDVDRDFTIAVHLSLSPLLTDEALARSSYYEKVTIPCTPTYELNGGLTACSWGKVVVQKPTTSNALIRQDGA